MVVVSDKAGSKLTVKETEKKVSLKDADGKAAEYEADEVLRASKATVENSALLRELIRQVESSHSTALILANGKNQQSVSQGVALSTIKAIMASLKKGEVEKGTKYEVYMTAASMPTPSTAKDLFADSVAAPKPVRIGSNPIFGACLMDLKEKMPRNESDAESHLRGALKKSTDPKEPVLVHLVVKQIKKSTGTGVGVCLSSVQFVFAKEQGDYFRAMHDKDEKVVPLPLFKEVVGGSRYAVVVAAVSGDDAARETVVLCGGAKLRGSRGGSPTVAANPLKTASSAGKKPTESNKKSKRGGFWSGGCCGSAPVAEKK
ncbi:hypothetical protein DQ04_07251020 [Trypanosoma grayi]|uniref:hypothetical protein n=1 Tax=Trypanosoma grayi TaxID=71804 RepID=UPI0004F4A1D2|nr:hypothetical protein DQ04_07251020 [Trypanosoma grayi]KEG08411.1 hypothetical protein DQ04_07251020 [Trypanosoma grayi]